MPNTYIDPQLTEADFTRAQVMNDKLELEVSLIHAPRTFLIRLGTAPVNIGLYTFGREEVVVPFVTLSWPDMMHCAVPVHLIGKTPLTENSDIQIRVSVLSNRTFYVRTVRPAPYMMKALLEGINMQLFNNVHPGKVAKAINMVQSWTNTDELIDASHHGESFQAFSVTGG